MNISKKNRKGEDADIYHPWKLEIFLVPPDDGCVFVDIIGFCYINQDFKSVERRSSVVFHFSNKGNPQTYNSSFSNHSSLQRYLKKVT